MDIFYFFLFTLHRVFDRLSDMKSDMVKSETVNDKNASAKITLSVYLDEGLKVKLEAAALEDGRSVSAEAAWLLREALK